MNNVSIMMPAKQFIKCFYDIPKQYGYFKYVDRKMLKRTVKGQKYTPINESVELSTNDKMKQIKSINDEIWKEWKDKS